MAGFDERQFAKAVQKREQSKKTKLAKENVSSNPFVFRKREKTSKKNKVTVCEDSNNNDFLKSLKSDSKHKESTESTMKKKLLGKIFKILQLKESTPKNTTAEEKRKVYRKRSRSSQSSNPSNFEPMPTIYEEDGEEDLISIASYEIRKQSIIAVA